MVLMEGKPTKFVYDTSLWGLATNPISVILKAIELRFLSFIYSSMVDSFILAILNQLISIIKALLVWAVVSSKALDLVNFT